MFGRGEAGGGAALVLFLVLIATGALLLFPYQPSTASPPRALSACKELGANAANRLAGRLLDRAAGVCWHGGSWAALTARWC